MNLHGPPLGPNEAVEMVLDIYQLIDGLESHPSNGARRKAIDRLHDAMALGKQMAEALAADASGSQETARTLFSQILATVQESAATLADAAPPAPQMVTAMVTNDPATGGFRVLSPNLPVIGRGPTPDAAIQDFSARAEEHIRQGGKPA